MDHSGFKEQDVVGVDLESGIRVKNNEEGGPDHGSDERLGKTIFLKLCDRFSSVDDDSLVKSGMNPLNVDEGSLENNVIEGGKKTEKEKRKKAKKPPRPPRPPKGFSWDAYDQKLIKELAELAMIKRARIERMKALKLKKSLKTSSSSSSSSSHGSLFAMLFTIIFFLVILLQGRNSGANLQGSPQTNENGSVFVQAQLSPLGSESISPISKSSTPF
ncbi:hypothetical protein OSB04_009437 [Centaurea solstitialis]|uniref:Transmembrane protein n=1 Tax=Centaurea solstitialis TaxID=347529 RepID=A0AA38TD63_9ASTR|nr:hypothetical protein OSB04_009437 [Centaurea solstitialis]